MKELSDLLLELYRASREVPLAQFQDSALALLKPSLPFDYSMWASASLNPANFGLHAIHVHNEPEEMLVEYEAVKDQDMVALALLKQKGGLLNVHSETVFTGKPLAAMRDFLRKFGHQNALITSRHNSHSDQLHFVSLYRADKDHQFTSTEGRLAQMLIPHLLEALAINRITHLERFVDGNRQLTHSVAITDRKGNLYHSDSGFLRLIQIEIPNWKVYRLPDSIIRDLEVTKRHNGKSIVIVAKHDADLLFLRARPRTKIDDLTAREFQVVQEVVQGATYRQIAAVLGIAPSTARSHIQTIYNKLEVNNKAELIMLADQRV